MIGIQDLMGELKLPRVTVQRAVRRLRIEPITDKPRRYMFTERQAATVRNLLRCWSRGERPQIGAR